jgi:ATP phosphoribosyltransferase regulatory subunit
MQTQLRLDFSIANDVNYYNGLIFQGFVHGVPGVVLSGGRYDLLLQRLEKPQGAVGFAVYLNALEMGGASAKASAPACQWLNVALPKGRLGEQVYGLFEKAGLSAGLALNEGRKLVFEDTKIRLRFFLVKPSDVAIYVERGAADIGVVGRDVLLESEADVMELLDLELGKCRMAVAGQRGSTEDLTRPLRVATKYPAVTRAYYAAKSRPVEIIKLHGSIELAPLLGLSDVIVDIVETGTTLKENDLEVITEILNISARLIVNRASFRFKEEAVATLQERLSEVV